MTPVPTSDGSGAAALVLFDGVCGLCNAWVDFVLRRDRAGRLRFAALQSTTGGRILRRHGLPVDFVDSIAVVDVHGRLLLRSAAVAAVLRLLPRPWPLAGVLLALPPAPLVDLGYGLVARVRYRIWGRRETCRLPSPAERARFMA